MTVIKVDPASIKRYGTTASGQFESINGQLKELVNQCATVHYHGTNAYEFKNKCADMAIEYATAARQDMKNIADAVRTATSNIARSLGGQAITIEMPSAASVAKPSISKGDGTEEVNTGALESLIPKVTGIFNKIDGLLDQHLSSLKGTVWEGNAKESAVSSVSKFTTQAKQSAGEAKTSITEYIRSQIDASTAADNTLSG